MTFTHDQAGTPATAWRADPRWAALLDGTGRPADDPLAEVDRVVVLAAHPDDETLGAGGLLATAHARGLTVSVVVATLGEASHPRSPTHTPAQLAERRARESHAAVATLAPGCVPLLLGLPDGGVADHEDTVTTAVVDVVGDGRRTLVVAPWRRDGHPDHEAVGRAGAAAAVRCGADLREYAVWFWHWASPVDAPWHRFTALPLGPAAVAAKAAAVRAHRTQVESLSDRPGDEVLLGPDLLAHAAGNVEVLVREPATDPALDRVHAETDDPWGVDRRWYEQRKRDLLLALLPHRRYGAALEVGCSTGATTLALAARCDLLTALDPSPHALALARTRLDADPAGARVRLLPGAVPDDQPPGPWDLVVVSEVGYFLSPAALDGLVARVVADLAPGGVVALAHWRHPVEGWPLDGADVHAAFTGVLPVAASYRDRDVEVLVLGHDVLPDPHD
ncbi:bifunctional PIG-L family deacetylase/class I SAM-dependent methyltransferase [Nocardioides sp. AX2bis]|uniref:bifunctional PIG-L family deacetylase/class I SAM-dependent methyltransferase n=1 Tax=Nocardioides sp. AX2bis TaxID=2653157 RepID=UPI00135BDC5F|nr:bifunctional PIG-L family deacetylase/class I SAM-dependent methyltransferase [Nocardioides sp. AX2bis]